MECIKMLLLWAIIIHAPVIVCTGNVYVAGNISLGMTLDGTTITHIDEHGLAKQLPLDVTDDITLVGLLRVTEQNILQIFSNIDLNEGFQVIVARKYPRHIRRCRDWNRRRYIVHFIANILSEHNAAFFQETNLHDLGFPEGQVRSRCNGPNNIYDQFPSHGDQPDGEDFRVISSSKVQFQIGTSMLCYVSRHGRWDFQSCPHGQENINAKFILVVTINFDMTIKVAIYSVAARKYYIPFSTGRHTTRRMSCNNAIWFTFHSCSTSFKRYAFESYVMPDHFLNTNTSVGLTRTRFTTRNSCENDSSIYKIVYNNTNSRILLGMYPGRRVCPRGQSYTDQSIRTMQTERRRIMRPAKNEFIFQK